MDAKLKFRGKELDGDKWLYGGIVTQNGRAFIVHTHITNEKTGRVYATLTEVDPESVCIYAGEFPEKEQIETNRK